MKNKIAVILLVLFMVALSPLQAKADENPYGVLDYQNSQYYLITSSKEFKLNYSGSQDLKSILGTLVSVQPSSQTEDTLTADNLNSIEYNKSVSSSKLRYVKVVYTDGIYYYVSGDKKVEIRSDSDLSKYINKNCDITLDSYIYSFNDGADSITLPWGQVSSITEGNPYEEYYKKITLKGIININSDNYLQVGDKKYKIFFDNSSAANKFRKYDNRYATVSGQQKYIKDLRDNSVQILNEIYSSNYTLTYKVHYKSVKAEGFINNNLKIGKYMLDQTADRYKSFIVRLNGKVAIKNNGIKNTVSKIIKPTKVAAISTTNYKLYKHLSSLSARNLTFKRAKALHFGSAHNSCVYFSSQALREVGVSIPKSTCVTNKFAYKLRVMGWKKVSSYRKLTPGSVCFTKDAFGGNGKPTHAYIFMGWVKKGDYTRAYICDNQAGDYSGKVLHIRNISIKSKHKGQYKDAFGFAMVSPKTYSYVK